jgi:hypothetical protein
MEASVIVRENLLIRHEDARQAHHSPREWTISETPDIKQIIIHWKYESLVKFEQKMVKKE